MNTEKITTRMGSTTVTQTVEGFELKNGPDIKITTTAEPDPYATERLAAATLDFYHRFMQRPDAKELLERKKAELRARGVRLN